MKNAIDCIHLINNFKQKTDIVGIFGAPRSGTTFQTLVVSELAQMPICRVQATEEAMDNIPLFLRSTNRIDPLRMIEQVEKVGSFVTHIHPMPDLQTIKWIRQLNVQVIFSTRDVPSMIGSFCNRFEQLMREHSNLVKKFGFAEFFFGPLPWSAIERFLCASKQYQLGFMVDICGPWYFQYLSAWDMAATSLPNFHRLSHHDLMSDTNVTIENILKFLGRDVSQEKVSKYLSTSLKSSDRKLRFNITSGGEFDYVSEYDINDLKKLLYLSEKMGDQEFLRSYLGTRTIELLEGSTKSFSRISSNQTLNKQSNRGNVKRNFFKMSETAYKSTSQRVLSFTSKFKSTIKASDQILLIRRAINNDDMSSVMNLIDSITMDREFVCDADRIRPFVDIGKEIVSLGHIEEGFQILRSLLRDNLTGCHYVGDPIIDLAFVSAGMADTVLRRYPIAAAKGIWPGTDVRKQQAASIADNIPPIFIVTIPKSGSLFISDTLTKLLRIPSMRISLDLFPEDQVIPAMASQLGLGGASTWGHIDPSPNNLAALRNAGLNKLILHLRDPRQTVVSFVHHIDDNLVGDNLFYRRRLIPPVPADFSDLSFLEKVDWYIQARFNSIIRWVMEWVDVADKDPSFEILLTTFEGFQNNEKNYFEKVLRHFGLEVTVDEKLLPKKEDDFHFRSGKVDEWREVCSEEQKKMMWNLMPRDICNRFNWIE